MLLVVVDAIMNFFIHLLLVGNFIMHLTSVEFMMDVSFWKISASWFLLTAASEQSLAVMMCTVLPQ